MSGGHWNYLGQKLEERAAHSDVWRLLGKIEHELDWGISGDTCYECAKIRTINALEVYFDSGATSVQDALALLNSREPECEKCKKWESERNAHLQAIESDPSKKVQTNDQAVAWCMNYSVDVIFDNDVVLYDNLSTCDPRILGRGKTLIDAVNDAIDRESR